MAFDQNAYTREYQKQTYDRLSIQVPKGKRQVLKNLAVSNGISINQCVIRAVEAYWNINLSK